MPLDIRARLSSLREAFVHADHYQDWVANWWARLAIEDRRLVLAHCGLDDDERAARRQWRQVAPDARDLILIECKRFARLVQPLQWA